MVIHTTGGRSRRAASWLLGTLVTLLAIFVALPVTADDKEPTSKEEKASAEKAVPAKTEADPQLQAPAFTEADRSNFGGFRIYGDLLLQYQTVSVDGNEHRYEKDFGFENGLYVGTSKLTFVPAGDDPAGWFDRLELYADGLGFDNNKKQRYRTWGVSANKAGKYRFRVNSRAHNYYWAWDGYGGEFDLYRNFTDVDLSVNATENVEVLARWRHWNTGGDQMTAFDYSRDEFEFPTTLDQTGNTFGFGLRWRIGQTTLFANQDFRSFNAKYRIVDTDNQGLNPAGAYIASIEQSEVREFDAPVTTGGFITNFADRKFRLEGDILWSKQELTGDYSLYWTGRNFAGQPYVDDTSNIGSANRDLLHYNVRLTWRPATSWSLTAQYRHRGYEQDGVAAQQSGVNPLPLWGYAHDIKLDQFVLGAEFAPVRAFSVFGEFGAGKRKQAINHEYRGQEEELDNIHSDHGLDDTDMLSYRFGVRFRAGRPFDLEASYERNDIDNPFTRFAPTAMDAFKAKARYRIGNKWAISGIYTYSKNGNDTLERTTGVSAESSIELNNLGINVNYMGGEGRFVYAGYQMVNNDIDMPIIFWNPTPRVRIDGDAVYAGKNNVWTLAGEYLFSQDFALSAYGNLNYVDSDTSQSGTPAIIWGGEAAFPIVYHDIRIGLRYVLDMGLILDAQGRFMKYEDKSVLYADNTYDASMFVFGVGYRF